MVNLTLIRQNFKEISMIFDVHEEEEMEIESQFHFNVNYIDNNSKCIADLKQELYLKKDPSKFKIVVEGLGYFNCEGIDSDENKKDAHVMSYMQLFPYIQNMISNMAVSAGLPPLIIPNVKMTRDSVAIQNNDNL